MLLVIYAKDVSRLAEFYRAVLDLPVERPDPGYAVLAASGWQLVINAVPAEIDDRIEISNPPVVREETPVKPSFPVRSIAEARDRAAAHGGAIGAVEREWTFRGRVHCDGYDPEGNVLQLNQEAPEPGRPGQAG